MGTYNDMVNVMKKYRFKEVTLSNGMVIRKKRDGSIQGINYDGHETDEENLKLYFNIMDSFTQA